MACRRDLRNLAFQRRVRRRKVGGAFCDHDFLSPVYAFQDAQVAARAPGDQVSEAGDHDESCQIEPHYLLAALVADRQ